MGGPQEIHRRPLHSRGRGAYALAEYCGDVRVVGETFKVPEGHVAIFFPDDAHIPDLCVERPAALKKAVLKVKY